MILENRYEIEVDETISIFQFTSEGKHEKILKVVRYSPTNLKTMYNLGFGDFDPETGLVDDKIVSDNGDGEKVLATVAATVYAFTAENPKVHVYIIGSNDVRTRLYRIGISKYLKEIQKDFDVYGLQKNLWKSFKPNTNYKAFLVKRKS
jgi:hypothetical protein